MSHKTYLDTARRTIHFLTDTLVVNDRLEVIGNDGWYTRGEKRSWWDQQSIDAGYTVYLYAMAYRILGDKEYLELARLCYDWFYGRNRSEVAVYDPITGGCYDAIAPWGLNLNQGAESSICLLLAHFAVQDLLAR
jgi:mannose/cellobiose epimerase-like protein (N-acyl-D-glucosamine 2-epimerase family)